MIMERTMDELAKKLNESHEREISKQLNDLVSRGIIIVESTQPIIIQELNPATGRTELKVSQAVRLVSKEHEYIKKIESELDWYKSRFESLRDSFNGE